MVIKISRDWGSTSSRRHRRLTRYQLNYDSLGESTFMRHMN
jgi:hypothetical protein